MVLVLLTAYHLKSITMCELVIFQPLHMLIHWNVGNLETEI